jgi:hypothetical protein
MFLIEQVDPLTADVNLGIEKGKTLQYQVYKSFKEELT